MEVQRGMRSVMHCRHPGHSDGLPIVLVRQYPGGSAALILQERAVPALHHYYYPVYDADGEQPHSTDEPDHKRPDRDNGDPGRVRELPGGSLQRLAYPGRVDTLPAVSLSGVPDRRQKPSAVERYRTRPTSKPARDKRYRSMPGERGGYSVRLLDRLPGSERVQT